MRPQHKTGSAAVANQLPFGNRAFCNRHAVFLQVPVTAITAVGVAYHNIIGPSAVTGKRAAGIAVVLITVNNAFPGRIYGRARWHAEIKGGNMLMRKQASVSLRHPVAIAFLKWKIIHIAVQVIGNPAAQRKKQQQPGSQQNNNYQNGYQNAL